jgi:predicted acyl esterase
MKRKRYSVLVACLLLVPLIASVSPAQTCRQYLDAIGGACGVPESVVNYIKNYIPQLYTGPYQAMWWYKKLLNPAQDWDVATVKFFDRLPGSRLPQGTIFERNVPVLMSDGLKLACNVFRPDKPGKFPVIANLTPFDKDAFLQHDAFGASEMTAFEAADPGYWTSNDYVVVLCDNRGSGRSQKGGTGGNYDLYDMIEWAGTQPWSNGKVGMLGHSALCMNQWNAAGMVNADGLPNPPPHLTAIGAWGGFNDQARDTKFPGGIPETQFAAAMGPNKPAWPQDAAPVQRPALPPSKLENIRIPALIGACWGDKKQHLRGDLRAWREITTLLKYKWLYTYSERKWQGLYTPEEARRTQRMFFDQFLKGIDSGIMEMPPVRLSVQVKLLDWIVRHEQDWPIPGTQYTKLYLGDKATLNLNQPRQAGETSYDWDSGKATFDVTFDKETELSGHIMARLWISPQNANDMDLFVTLRKIDAYGHEINFDSDSEPGRLPVDYGFMRLSKRALDPKLSKPWLPEQLSVVPEGPNQKVKPGQVVPCEIQVVGSSTVFYPGEKLRLELSGKLPDDNLFGYHDTVNAGKHAIHFGGEYDSYLMVPVVPANKGRK